MSAENAAPAYERDPATGDPVYLCKLRMIGPPLELKLTEHALEWSAGKRAGRAPYKRIERVRLSFEPVAGSSHSFICSIWDQSGLKMRTASSSWASMVKREPQNAAYADFVAELIRRIEAAGGRTRLEAGFGHLWWWGFSALSVAIIAMMATFTLYALAMPQKGPGLLIAAFTLYFGWLLGNIALRNKPGVLNANTLPSRLLPER